MMLSMAATALAQVEGGENGTNQTGFRNTTSIESIGPEISNGAPWYENSWIIVVGLIASLITIGSLIFWIYTNLISKGKNKTELEIKVSESSSAVRISNIPHPHNPNFTGRVDLLDRLSEALASGERAAFTQTSAITGLGGVGKTQLALEYSYRHADDYQVIWWVRSEEPATLAADYAGLALRLDLPEKGTQDQRVTVEAVRRWLEQNGGWLLVFDNAQDPEELNDYLPRTGAGHVIITSRNPNWGGTAKPLPVDVFSREESVEFLKNRTGGQEDGADTLAEALGNLPLALEQAGAYIQETGISLSAYIKLFQERQKELLRRGKPDAYPDTVATTWDLSFQKASEEVPASADLLKLCAFLAPDDIPKSLLTDGVEHLPESLASAVKDEMKLNDAVAALKRYSLMTVADDSLSVHRLVQAVARDRLSDVDRKRWAEAAVQLVNKVFPYESYDFRTWAKCSILLPHALAAAGHSEELEVAHEATSRLLNQAGLYLRGRAEFSEAKSVHERALQIDEKVYGPDHPEVATDVNNLGGVLRALGDLAGAKKSYERALQIDEKVYGPDHPEVATDVNNLGGVLEDLGDLAGAKKSYERALKIFQHFLGEDHPKTKTVRKNLESLRR
jgi:tetratricopeptide (TPR) repeat protein